MQRDSKRAPLCYPERVRAPYAWTLASLTLVSFFSGTRLLSAPAAQPKLVVAIIIDQFRYDYLTRFESEYRGGLHRLVTQGADFTNAFYGQVPTVTAVGHSIFLSGAMPAVSGIIGNSWYDRATGQLVTSVCDWTEKTVGGNQASQRKACTDADPASPRRLLVTTLGDELRLAHHGSKVIGISLKARAAILPSGHAANAAFWFDDVSGNFVSSTFYAGELPAWAGAFNNQRLADEYVGKAWPGFPDYTFRVPHGAEKYSKLPASPWGNELVERFAESALVGEKLGQRGETDLLTISFSSNDYVGHAVGPYAPEVKDMSLRVDQLLGKLLTEIDAKVGLQNTLIVLSADHGVAATPKQAAEFKAPGGYVDPSALTSTVVEALNKRFGSHEWLIPEDGESAFYFNWKAIENVRAGGERINPQEIYATAREALLSDERLHVMRVYSRPQLDAGLAGDFITQAEMNGYFSRRSGDLNLVFESGYEPGNHGTNHFSPYAYDTHVPVLFLGPAVRRGHYDDLIRPNDIAPTLATVLKLQTPSGSSGRVLTEMLAGTAPAGLTAQRPK